MKIIGKWDYWDTVGHHYGDEDSSVILKKDLPAPSEFTVGNQINSKLWVGLKTHISDVADLRLFRLYERNHKVEEPSIRGFVLMGEDVYPFVASVVCQLNSLQRHCIKAAYTFEDCEKLYPEWTEKVAKSPSYASFNSVKGLRHFFDSPRERLAVKSSEFLIENEAAFAMVSQYKGDDHPSVVFNPSNLKEIRFGSVLNPYQMWQRVHSWQSGVLSNNPQIEELSDKTKIVKAGFDLKSSFRKDKASE